MHRDRLPQSGSGSSPRPRVAIAHDYLTQRGGAERVVLSLVRAFPDAVIHTTLYEPGQTYPEFADRDIRVSGLNRLRPLRLRHRAALPLLPLASSRVRIDADVVIASSTGWAHGFTTTGRKLVYCHSPARWLYEEADYLGERTGLGKRVALRVLRKRLTRWDRSAAASADAYLAVSRVVQARITRAYGIDSAIVPPPVAIDPSAPRRPHAGVARFLAGEPYYVCLARLLPYKNVAQVVSAVAATGARLVVVGRGPQEAALRAALPARCLLVGDLDDAQVRWLYAGCTALVTASHEDFGLTPLEAAAFGKPCAVLRGGGFLDTVVEGETGVFFDAPEPALIAAALDRLRATRWSPDVIRAHAASFGEAHFIAALRATVEALLGADADASDLAARASVPAVRRPQPRRLVPRPVPSETLKEPIR